MTDIRSKIIDDFPNYRIYEDGRVENIKTDRILKISIDNYEYSRVSLSNLSYKRSLLLHRLLAEAFI